MTQLNQQSEPAITTAGITLGSVTALVLAATALLHAFDVYNFSPEQIAAIVGFLGALWAVVIPMVYAIRGQVYSPETVEKIAAGDVTRLPNP
jgi:hypothetical protein